MAQVTSQDSSDSKANDNPEKISPSAVSTLIKAIQTALSLIVGFAAIFAATGFLIVKLSLSKYTDISGYNIAPAQYLYSGDFSGTDQAGAKRG